MAIYLPNLNRWVGKGSKLVCQQSCICKGGPKKWTCIKCEKTKPVERFYYYPEKYKHPINLCRSCMRTKIKKVRDTLKIEAFRAYGDGSCYCCGETNIGFLTLDHSFNDGMKHRKSVGCDGSGFYRNLQKDGWPKDLGLRVACYNCNFGRRHGLCPHQQ